MSHKDKQEEMQEEMQEETQSLGDFLREHREQKGASLTEATEATKISLPVLKAIEEDAYDRMPAEAFCRGFYSLYANFLEIDPQIVLDRYDAGKESDQNVLKKQAKPPVLKSRSSTNYAEPSHISPATSMTILTAASLIIIAGLCWYFNWNPVDYINAKLLPPQTLMEQKLTEPAYQAPAEPQANPAGIEATTPPQAPVPIEEPLNDEPETDITDTEVIEELPENAQVSPPEATPYHLEMYFSNNGTLKVTLDDGFVLDKRFSAGETLRWAVEKNIILDMPGTIDGTLRLNGIEIPLPAAENGRRTLSLPEDLLD
jgi:cytoskeletal protein RodZ